MDMNPHLRSLLLEKGRVTADALSEAEQRHDQCHVIERLVVAGLIDETVLAADLAQRTGRPRVSLDEANPEERAIASVSGPVCARFLVVPIELSSSSKGPHLVLAMADPLDVEAIRAVHAEAEMRISPLVASSSEIRRAIERTYGLPSPTPAPSHPTVTDPHTQDQHGVGEGATPEAFSDLFEDMDEDVEGLLGQLRSVDNPQDSQRILRRAVHHAESERDRLLYALALVLMESGTFERPPLRKHSEARQGEPTVTERKRDPFTN